MTERLILVGTGGFGRCWQAAIAARPDRVEVVGIVEPDDEERGRARQHFGLPDHRAITRADGRLKRLDATFAIDSSPFFHRRANAEAVFGAGADLLAAKPLSGSFADAEAIVRAASAHSRSVAVAQQMRYFPAFLELRRLLQAGTYGRVRAVEIEMALDGRGWRPGTEWRLTLDHPLLLEAGIHHFDLLRWTLATEVDVVDAVEWNPPWSPFACGATVSAILRTTGDVPVVYSATFAPRPEQTPVRFDSGWRVVCEDALLTVVDGGLFVDGRPTTVASTPEPVPLEDLNDMVLETWLTARADGRPPPFDGADNLCSMAVLDRAVRAVGPRR